MGNIQQHSRDATNAHESALQQVSHRANTDAEAIFATLSAAVATSASLHNDIVHQPLNLAFR